MVKYSEKALNSKITLLRTRFTGDCARLETVNPFSVLKRGFAVVSGEDGQRLVSKQQVKKGQNVYIKLNDGGFTATVTGVD